MGTSAGVEKLRNTLQTLLEAYPELVALQFDAVSAFNNMRRERVLAGVQEMTPHLLAFASLWLTRPSVAVLRKADGSYAQLPVTTGVDQGDPMAPFLFALGLPLAEIRARLRGLLGENLGDRQR